MIWVIVAFAGIPVCPVSKPRPTSIPSKFETATSVFPEIIRTPVKVRNGGSKVTTGAVVYRDPPLAIDTDFNDPTVTVAAAPPPPPITFTVGAVWYPVPGKTSENDESAPPAVVDPATTAALTGLPPDNVTTGAVLGEYPDPAEPNRTPMT
jgi:hypothetical protein